MTRRPLTILNSRSNPTEVGTRYRMLRFRTAIRKRLHGGQIVFSEFRAALTALAVQNPFRVKESPQSRLNGSSFAPSLRTTTFIPCKTIGTQITISDGNDLPDSFIVEEDACHFEELVLAAMDYARSNEIEDFVPDRSLRQFRIETDPMLERHHTNMDQADGMTFARLEFDDEASAP